MQHYFKHAIKQDTADVIASSCFSTFKRFIVGEINKPCFKTIDDYNYLENRRNRAGFKLKIEKCIVKWDEMKIPFKIENDEYIVEALKNYDFVRTRIIRKSIKSKYKFYLQIVIKGKPPVKINKDFPLNPINSGKVGLDIGIDTIAIYSDNVLELVNLVPEKVNKIANEIKNIQNDLKVMKKEYYSGHLNKNLECDFYQSIEYKDKRNKINELYRKSQCYRKQYLDILANYILTFGDKVLVEQMSFNKLKEKGYGKNIAKAAPALLLEILDKKLTFWGKNLIKVNTFKVRASQYNHITGEYTKRDVSEKWIKINGLTLQRDLYSAFLIYNVHANLNSIDRDACLNNFNNFLILYNNLSKNILNFEVYSRAKFKY